MSDNTAVVLLFGPIVWTLAYMLYKITKDLTKD